MRSFNATALASRILVAGSIFALAGCAGLPAVADRQPSSAYVDTGGTRLGRAVAGAVAAHPGKTGVIRCSTAATPSPRACCSPQPPSAASTCSTTSGTTT